MDWAQNECTVEWLLRSFPELKLQPVPLSLRQGLCCAYTYDDDDSTNGSHSSTNDSNNGHRYKSDNNTSDITTIQGRKGTNVWGLTREERECVLRIEPRLPRRVDRDDQEQFCANGDVNAFFVALFRKETWWWYRKNAMNSAAHDPSNHHDYKHCTRRIILVFPLMSLSASLPPSLSPSPPTTAFPLVTRWNKQQWFIIVSLFCFQFGSDEWPLLWRQLNLQLLKLFI